MEAQTPKVKSSTKIRSPSSVQKDASRVRSGRCPGWVMEVIAELWPSVFHNDLSFGDHGNVLSSYWPPEVRNDNQAYWAFLISVAALRTVDDLRDGRCVAEQVWKNTFECLPKDTQSIFTKGYVLSQYHKTKLEAKRANDGVPSISSLYKHHLLDRGKDADCAIACRKAVCYLRMYSQLEGFRTNSKPDDTTQRQRKVKRNKMSGEEEALMLTDFAWAKRHILIALQHWSRVRKLTNTHYATYQPLPKAWREDNSSDEETSDQETEDYDQIDIWAN